MIRYDIDTLVDRWMACVSPYNRDVFQNKKFKKARIKRLLWVFLQIKKKLHIAIQNNNELTANIAPLQKTQKKLIDLSQ